MQYPKRGTPRLNWTAPSGILLAILSLSAWPALAQPADNFELRTGDRVVFVGDGLIENEQRFGYSESALTTRWPAQNVSFRNVGWSGDTVFGEARDHYTNPPTPFEHLIEQVRTARPTVIVFGYGGTLAFENVEAIASFSQGYSQLLDSLTVSGSRCVILAPLPQDERTSPHPELSGPNEQLRLARDVAEQVAREHGCVFVDLFASMHSHFQEATAPLTENGIHLNAEGYRILAAVIERSLTESHRDTALSLDIATGRVDGGILQGKVVQLDDSYQFALMPHILATVGQQGRTLRLTGLRRGTYTLLADDVELGTASASSWADGALIIHPAEHAQANELRQIIIAKNQLYFRQYRPQNETYLVGFRRHEQGQNAAELEQLNPLIGEKENGIGRLSVPRLLRFSLKRK